LSSDNPIVAGFANDGSIIFQRKAQGQAQEQLLGSKNW
jgi:hypothetical protein